MSQWPFAPDSKQYPLLNLSFVSLSSQIWAIVANMLGRIVHNAVSKWRFKESIDTGSPAVVTILVNIPVRLRMTLSLSAVSLAFLCRIECSDCERALNYSIFFSFSLILFARLWYMYSPVLMSVFFSLNTVELLHHIHVPYEEPLDVKTPNDKNCGQCGKKPGLGKKWLCDECCYVGLCRVVLLELLLF